MLFHFVLLFLIIGIEAVNHTRFKRGPAEIHIISPGEVVEPEELMNLEELNPRNLGQYIGNINDDTAANSLKGLQFLAKYKIIGNDFDCEKCNSAMGLNRDSTKIKHDNYGWRCAECRKQGANSRKTSWLFFPQPKMTVQEVLFLAAEWVENPAKPLRDVAKLYGISPATVVEAQEWFRQMTMQWFERESARNPNVKLGGADKIVEIDETLMYKAKYNRGAMLGRPQVVMFRVNDRKATTLLPLIAQYVESGTTIVSDGWAAYQGIPAIPNGGYTHKVVNHKYNFVNPTDADAHTQSIESTWGVLKRQLKARFGDPEGRLEGHMFNYMWRRFFDKKLLLNRLIYEMKFFRREKKTGTKDDTTTTTSPSTVPPSDDDSNLGVGSHVDSSSDDTTDAGDSSPVPDSDTSSLSSNDRSYPSTSNSNRRHRHRNRGHSATAAPASTTSPPKTTGIPRSYRKKGRTTPIPTTTSTSTTTTLSTTTPARPTLRARGSRRTTTHTPTTASSTTVIPSTSPSNSRARGRPTRRPATATTTVADSDHTTTTPTSPPDTHDASRARKTAASRKPTSSHGAAPPKSKATPPPPKSKATPPPPKSKATPPPPKSKATPPPPKSKATSVSAKSKATSVSAKSKGASKTPADTSVKMSATSASKKAVSNVKVPKRPKFV